MRGGAIGGADETGDGDCEGGEGGWGCVGGESEWVGGKGGALRGLGFERLGGWGWRLGI